MGGSRATGRGVGGTEDTMLFGSPQEQMCCAHLKQISYLEAENAIMKKELEKYRRESKRKELVVNAVCT